MVTIFDDDKAGADISSKIYWPDFGLSTIQRMNIDGSNIEEVVPLAGANKPPTSYWDKDSGKIYWSDTGTNTIKYANLDGSNIETLVPVNFSDDPPFIPIWLTAELALDNVNRKLYWSDFGSETIKRVNLDGTNIEELISDSAYSIALDLEEEKIYFAHSNHGVRRANLDGTSIEDILFGHDHPNGGGFSCGKYGIRYCRPQIILCGNSA